MELKTKPLIIGSIILLGLLCSFLLYEKDLKGGSQLTTGSTKEEIPQLTIGQEVIMFPYTDENINENIIIRTDKKDYDDIGGTVVYISVENKTGKDQNIDTKVLFRDKSKSIVTIKKAFQKQRVDTRYDEIENCESKTATGTCDHVLKSSTSTTDYYEWQSQPVSKTISEEPSITLDYDKKNVENFTNDKVISSLIKNGEIAYYKAEISYPSKTKDNFYIEAAGDAGGYGHLDPWLDSSYAYRKLITIASSTGAGTDYQVLLKVGQTASSTGSDFNLGGHSLNFPHDIRFTDSGGSNQLSYWQWKVTGVSPSSTAYFYVKVTDTLDATGTIYIYYGKTAGTSASNGANTFLFFDDFTTIDTSVWTQTGTNSIVSSTILRSGQTVSNASSYLQTTSSIYFGNNTEMMASSSFNKTSVSYIYLGYYDVSGMFGHAWSRSTKTYWVSPDTQFDTIYSGVWHTWQAQRYGVNSCKAIISGGTKATMSGCSTATSTIRVASAYDKTTNVYSYTDWVLIKKMITTEPAFYSVGAEEQNVVTALNSIIIQINE